MLKDIVFFSQYCERTQNGLWAEPLNAISNIAFLIAGAVCLKIYLSNKTASQSHDITVLILILFLFCIAIGSTLWHTLASPWTEFADALPILCFIGLYLILFLRRVVNLSIVMTTIAFIFFESINMGVIIFASKSILNRSLFYLPTIFVFIFVTVYVYRINYPLKNHLGIALMTFITALLLRTVDLDLCNMIHTGTHFLWHVLIAYVLYQSTRFLIYFQPNKL